MARKARKQAKATKKRRASARRGDSLPRVAIGREVQRQIQRFGLSREVAATAVGDAASQVSRLMTHHFGDFSAGRLVKMLLRLGSDVTIGIRHAKRLGRRGRVRVVVR